MSTSDLEADAHPGPGGYDIEYRAAPNFWGGEPASLVRGLEAAFPDLRARNVLDVGCGDGKNAAYLARLGCDVDAFDVSPYAIGNARELWDSEIQARARFEVGDAMQVSFPRADYDLVIACGLFHCLGGAKRVAELVDRLAQVTRPGGVHVICALNSRLDGFADGHVAFRPSLCTHAEYLVPYVRWAITCESDADLTESHPPLFKTHTHAATRFYAQRSLD